MSSSSLVLLLCFALFITCNAIIRSSHIGALNVGLVSRATEHHHHQQQQLTREKFQQLKQIKDDSYLYFTQKLDHFDSQNSQTWQQRYLVNATFFQGGNAPVFLVLGGEGLMSTHYVSGHFISNQYAQEFGALIVALEHRYYGQSIPTPDTSTSNLQYLSSQQALADAAAFRQFIAQTYNANGPWIVFGGSYSGSLSAWLKMKYPHLFAGSIATSAPVLAQLDFYQYLQVVSNSVGPTCSQRFADATASIQTLLNSQDGRTKAQQMFNTCTPLLTDNDVKLFWQGLIDGPSGVVQYNADNVNYQPFDITYMCSLLQSGTDAMSAWANLTLTFQAGSCLEVNYTQYISEMQPTSDGRSWTYQTCREFGYFQAGDGANQPFSPTLDLQFSIQQCQDIYGQPFVPDTNFTNLYYGGVDLVTTNTFMPNGDIDPWHALGTCYEKVGAGRYIGPGSATVLIHNTAHCADLYPPRDQDAPGLVAARIIEESLIGQWIAQYNQL